MKTVETDTLDAISRDLVLREIWQTKDALSATRGHDIDRLFAEARARQARSGRPAVNLQERKPRAKPVPGLAT